MVNPFADLPSEPLAQLPTPIQALPTLSKALDVDLYIKRDDLTGLAFGGNKTRKLSLLTAEAKLQGANCLVTVGAPQSNHCRQTAAAAARLGMSCRLALMGTEPTMARGNILLDQLLGASVSWIQDQPRDEALDEMMQSARVEGLKPYLIPYGGSNPLGVAAISLAMQELLAQDDAFDWIVLASSSGGTQSGLMLGAALNGFGGTILGISVDPDREQLAEDIGRLLAETIDRFHLEVDIAKLEPRIRDDFRGDGYAIIGDLERETVRRFASQEGILLDPVYTGRAAGAMLSLINSGELPSGSRGLFWHTGGTPALFAFDQSLVG